MSASLPRLYVAVAKNDAIQRGSFDHLYYLSGSQETYRVSSLSTGMGDLTRIMKQVICACATNLTTLEGSEVLHRGVGPVQSLCCEVEPVVTQGHRTTRFPRQRSMRLFCINAFAHLRLHLREI